MKTKLGQSVANRRGYSTYELLNDQGELIGYIVYSPSGIAIGCFSTEGEAYGRVTKYIQIDEAESVPKHDGIKPPKP